jgi:hypothetical protein
MAGGTVADATSVCSLRWQQLVLGGSAAPAKAVAGTAKQARPA